MPQQSSRFKRSPISIALEISLDSAKAAPKLIPMSITLELGGGPRLLRKTFGGDEDQFVPFFAIKHSNMGDVVGSIHIITPSCDPIIGNQDASLDSMYCAFTGLLLSDHSTIEQANTNATTHKTDLTESHENFSRAIKNFISKNDEPMVSRVNKQVKNNQLFSVKDVKIEHMSVKTLYSSKLERGLELGLPRFAPHPVDLAADIRRFMPVRALIRPAWRSISHLQRIECARIMHILKNEAQYSFKNYNISSLQLATVQGKYARYEHPELKRKPAAHNRLWANTGDYGRKKPVVDRTIMPHKSRRHWSIIIQRTKEERSAEEDKFWWSGTGKAPKMDQSGHTRETAKQASMGIVKNDRPAVVSALNLAEPLKLTRDLIARVDSSYQSQLEEADYVSDEECLLSQLLKKQTIEDPTEKLSKTIEDKNRWGRSSFTEGIVYCNTKDLQDLQKRASKSHLALRMSLALTPQKANIQRTAVHTHRVLTYMEFNDRLSVRSPPHSPSPLREAKGQIKIKKRDNLEIGSSVGLGYIQNQE